MRTVMKNKKLVVLIVAMLAIGIGFWFWWQHEKVFPSTEDAYLEANILTIVPQVGGRVTQVAVVENQRVESGDLLFQIDTASLEAALHSAQAGYRIAQQDAGASAADVSVARANLANAKAALTDAQITYDRTAPLVQKGVMARSSLDQVTEARSQAQAGVAAAEAAVAAARAKSGLPGDGNAAVQAALGVLAAAQIDLAHSRVTAPAAGWITNIELRPGQVVASGAPLFSLVEDGAWWVSANFKETDLQRIRPGQPVALAVDMYPGTTLTGTVQSLGAGSGAVFSLLPAQNATGNWVKVTQRFPVRIRIDKKPGDPALQLRVGASTTATVDTSAMDRAK